MVKRGMENERDSRKMRAVRELGGYFYLEQHEVLATTPVTSTNSKCID
jgi:hypothetical protein